MSDLKNITDGTLVYFRLDVVSISLLNPRKDVKPEGIEELAESVIEHGIIQAPSGRLTPEGNPELMFGQRRFFGACRAVSLATQRDLAPKYPDRALPDGSMPVTRADELAWLPIVIRVMSDEDALEMMLIENLQRENVSPREEADGYAQLLAVPDANGGKRYTVTSLAKKIGMTKSYVTNRLKMLKAPELMWIAYEAKLIGTRHLEIAGRIPQQKRREEFAQLVINPSKTGKPLSGDDAQDLANAKFMVKLRPIKDVDLEDPKLVPVQYEDGERVKGGKCSECPLRSGNCIELQEELQSTGGKGGDKGKTGVDPNICLNPSCYQEKQDAAWRVITANAEENGQRVMDVDRSSEVFETWGDFKISPKSGLVELADAPDFHATGNHASADTMPPWEKLIAGTDATKKVITARHPQTKKIVLLIEREEAIAAAETNLGEEVKTSPFANRPKPAKAAPVDKAQAARDLAERQRENQIEVLASRLFLEQVSDKLTTPEVRNGTHPVWNLLLREIFILCALDDNTDIAHLFGKAEEEVQGCYGEDLWDACKPQVEEMAKGGNELRVIALLAIATATSTMGSLDDKPEVCGIAATLGLNLQAITEIAVERVASAEKKAKDKDSKEELFTCPQCQQANFTKRGLAAHNCARRQAANKVHVADTPAEFAFLLMDAEVKPTKPNEHKVFPDIVSVCLNLKKKATIKIELACNDAGEWGCGYHWEAGKLDASALGAGGLPSCSDLHATRGAAIEAELKSLIGYFAKNDKLKPMAEALKSAQAEFGTKGITPAAETPRKVEKQMLLLPEAAVNRTEDPAEFARMLGSLPVHVSEPNASDVFTDNVLIRLDLPEAKAYAQIELCTTKEGEWGTGWEFEPGSLAKGSKRASGLPHAMLLMPTRKDAVCNEISGFLKYLEAHADFRPLLDKLEAAGHEFLRLSGGDEAPAPVPPAEPAPAPKAKVVAVVTANAKGSGKTKLAKAAAKAPAKKADAPAKPAAKKAVKNKK